MGSFLVASSGAQVLLFLFAQDDKLKEDELGGLNMVLIQRATSF